MLRSSSPVPQAFNSPKRAISKRNTSGSRSRNISTATHLKPSHLSAYRMEIGQWSESAEFNGVLTLKIYHSRGQIVLERMSRGRKRKIQYSMENIDQIYLYHHTSRVSIADFFVRPSPSCFCEIDPAPRSNTTWEECEDDFCSGQSLAAMFVRCYLKTTTSAKHFIRLQSHPSLQSKIFFHAPSHADWIAHDSRHNISPCILPTGTTYTVENKHAPPVYTGWSNLYVQHMAARLGLKDDWDDGDSTTSNSSFQSSSNSEYDSLDDGIQGQERYLNFDVILKGFSQGER